MKNIFYLIFFFSALILNSQSWSEFNTPKQINNFKGYSTVDYGSSVYNDGKGFIYITGFFDGRIKFGSTELIGKGDKDIFIVKMDTVGNYIWAKSAGGSLGDYGREISVDNYGNVYLIGYFFGSATFGTSTLNSNGQSDIFIAKLNSSGTWQWAKSAGGIGFDRGNTISVSSNGSCYISGVFEQTTTFGSTSLTSSGSKDIFISKLSSTGSWLWTKKIGSTSTEEVHSIKYTNIGKFLAVTGYFSGSCNFIDTTCSSKGQRDLFVSKLDSNGNFIFTRPGGSIVNDESKCVNIDNNLNILITGYYESNLTLGPLTLSNINKKDVFTAKLNSSGVWQWALSATGTNNQESYSLALDKSDNLLVSGYFYNTINFAGNSKTSSADRDLFVVRIKNNGTYDTAYTYNCTSSIDPYSICIDNNSNFYTIGTYYKKANFGSNEIESTGDADIFLFKSDSLNSIKFVKSLNGFIPKIVSKTFKLDKYGNKFIAGYFYGNAVFNNDTLNSLGGSDIFIAKADANGNFLWGKQYGGFGNDYAFSIDLDSANNIYLTGSYNQALRIGIDSLNYYGLYDILLCKFDSTGTPQKALGFGSSGMDEGIDLDVLPDGTFYLTGYFNNTVNFEGNNLTSKGSDDIFVAKINNNLDFSWASKAGGNDFDSPSSISVNSAKQIVVTGHIEQTADFGNINLFGPGGDEIFIARISDSGNWLWAKYAGSENWAEEGSKIINDSNGNIFVSGKFLGVSEFGTDLLVSYGNADLFLSKLDSNGNWIWNKSFGCSGIDEVSGLNLDNCGYLYLLSSFTDTLKIDDNNIISNGSQDIFLSKFNSNGNLSEFKQIGGIYNDEAVEIIPQDCYNLFVCGNFTGSITINTYSQTLNSNLDLNTFIIKQGLLSPESNWTFKTNTGKSMDIQVPASIHPRFNHRELINGDAIGVFFIRNQNYNCAGYGKWNGFDLTFKVWGDDINTAIKDGMADNEKLYFKLFDALRGLDTLVEVRVLTGPSTFMNDSVTILKTIPKSDDSLKIPLKAGWNMISSYLLPYRNLSMDSIFYNIKSSITIVKNSSGQSYIPEFNINTIGNWNIQQGYLLYAKKIDTLVMTGVFVIPDTISIACKQGWNIISYLRNTALETELSFADFNIDSSLVIAKNIQGQTYIPSYNIDNINFLQPKSAYQIYLKFADTIKYPSNTVPFTKIKENNEDIKTSSEMINTKRNQQNIDIFIKKED